MKSMTLALLLPLALHAEHEVGFIERFALGTDREKALQELVPGTEEYYVFHALHYQNQRNTERLNSILDQWRQRSPGENAARQKIETREALLKYEQDPKGTLQYLTDLLEVRHDHQQQVRDQKPNLPTSLEAARVDRSVFLTNALRHDSGLQSLSADALASLIRDQATLTPAQRRAVLQRLTRPDIPHLVEAIIADLNAERSGGFGSLSIHRALLPAQLDSLLQTFPDLAGQDAFVHLRVRKLAPDTDTDITLDTAAREAWLERVWSWVAKLPESQNTLKGRVLYLRLDHDRKQGVYNRSRFIEYLKSPRSVDYINKKLVDNLPHGQLQDLHADLSTALLEAPPLGSDEPLVRDYFLHLLTEDAKATPNADDLLKNWTPYVRDSWLRPILAEALILSGTGSPEQWASLLTPTAFQRLKERVDIDFPSTNTAFFKPGDDIRFDVVVKNTPKLLIKIFEINTLNYFQTRSEQLNTNVNLDGLVANAEQTHTFDTGPFKSTRQTFQFPELKGKRGAWIIEFIGGGRSSRALIRVGQWKTLQQTGPAGDLLLVLDENNQPVPDAVVWFEGRKFTRDAKLDRVLIPFTKQPGTKPIIIGDAAGAFATRTQFEHHQENYALNARFHLEREQLLSRRQATLGVRVDLLLGGTHLAPSLLLEPKLTLKSTTLDGVMTLQEIKDIKLDATGLLTHTLNVPDRLASLSARLSGKIEMLSQGGEKQDLAAEELWELNGIDTTVAVNEGHLSTFAGSRVFELLGKNGEPIIDQQVVFKFKHQDFGQPQTIPLRTDERGRIMLGQLKDIESVSCVLPNGNSRTWNLNQAEVTMNSQIHVQAGSTVQIPLSEPTSGPISLLSSNTGGFDADVSHLAQVSDGKLVLNGLKPGSYSLQLPHQKASIQIEVAKGTSVAGWVLGQSRQLQLHGAAPLTIDQVNSTAEFITIRLGNSTPFTRVHIAATRFAAEKTLFDSLAAFPRFGAASGTPDVWPSLYSTGREIGDEYRYILERRYAKRYPGNMLTRPGLLLNPWSVRETDTQELSQFKGQLASATSGGRNGMARLSPMAAPTKAPEDNLGQNRANLDFLAQSAPTVFNLRPDKDGIVKVERKALGDRQTIYIYAEDLENAAQHVLHLAEVPTAFADRRMLKNLEPTQSFTEKKEISILNAGQSLTLQDVLTSEMETYDSLKRVHSLFSTLTQDPNLALFAFLLDWPKLDAVTKKARYGEYACHELNFFLSRKDKPFFDEVIKPYLAHKKDKTFMDEYLLGLDLQHYIQPWAYAQLNIVERILLAQRIEGEAANASRHVRELWEMIPPDPEMEDFIFEAALRGSGMDINNTASVALSSAMPAAPPPESSADAFASPSAPGKEAFSNERAKKELQESPKSVDTPRLRSASEQLGDNSNVRVGVVSGSSGVALNFFDETSAVHARQVARAFFRPAGTTQQWAENNYFKRRISEQDASLVTANAFWLDYASWIASGAKGNFVSSHVAKAASHFTEMLLALAVLDLPFEPGKHTTKTEGNQLTFTASSPCLIFHKQVKPTTVDTQPQGQLLVSQSFFNQSDRYRQEGNEKIEKYVTDEFLTGVTYGANVVVTNPTSSIVKAEVLLQIPEGALPVLNSKATSSQQLQLRPYTTQTFEYYFYFPKVAARAGQKFKHFPVNVTTASSTSAAKPFEFNVVSKLTQVDKASWEYVSQYGSETDVLTFLQQSNLETLNLELVAWRCRQSEDFYKRLVAFLKAHHQPNLAIFSYALRYDDTATLREWLKFNSEIAEQCSPWLQTSLVTFDSTERHEYEHLEYSPLINQRAHRLGSDWRIANPVILEHYQHLLATLAHKPTLDAQDNMSVVYFLFLQDRQEEALERLKGIDATKLPTRLQHDYFQCYAAFYEGDVQRAQRIAGQYTEHPVPRWKKLFAEVSAQAAEANGTEVNREKSAEPDREQQQGQLANTEPSFDFKVEGQAIHLNWKNLDAVTVNYYLMDPEFSFSSSPFVSQDAGRFSIVKPAKSVTQPLPKGQNSQTLSLPEDYSKANVLVEVIGAGQRKAQAHHSNTLKLTLAENYGRLEVHDSTTDKPLPKTYVKVYAKLNNGTTRFFKDGYTDLRGRFDYASLNAPEENHTSIPAAATSPGPSGLDYQMLKPAELSEVSKLSLLILHDTHGATVKEVNPPGQ